MSIKIKTEIIETETKHVDRLNFKKSYSYFEEKVLLPLLTVTLLSSSLLAIYVYLETQTNYL
jgi:cell division protein FtsL